MHRLERIVSKAFNSLAKAEDRLVNSAYASRFSMKHPILPGFMGGAGVAVAVAYLYSQASPSGARLGIDIYTLAIPAAAAGTGFMLYDLARQHREVSDAGLPVEKFYELSSGKGNQRKAALFLSTLSLAAANGYAYHSGLSLETLAKMDVLAAPAIYLCARAFTNASKPISNAASFKAAITEWVAIIASKATGNRQLHIKALENDARNFPSAQTKMALAEAYFGAGRLDDGLIQAKEAVEQKTDLLQLFLPRAGRKKIEAAAKAHKAIRIGKASHADYIEFSRCCHAIGETEKAEKSIKEMTVKFPSIESDIMAAMSLDAIGKEQKAAAYWNSAVSSIFSKPELKVLPVSEKGTHNTRRYGPTPLISNTFIFRETESQAETEFEKSTNAMLRSMLKHHHYYTVPKTVAEFAHRNGRTRYDLVLLYLDGKSPSEMRQEGTLEHKHITAIIDYLSWIHKNVKTELSRKGKINFDSKLEHVINNPHLGLPEQLADRIKANIGFITEKQKDSPYVFAKDPHPAQWRFGKDYLAALDWEDMGATSMFVDSAKFYIHPDIMFTEAMLDAVHGEAASLYRDNLFGNDSEFRERMLDAMLFQALSFASAWSFPEMSHMRGKRATVIAGTPVAFELMRRNHPAHYFQNRLSYGRLEGGFKEMHELLAGSS